MEKTEKLKDKLIAFVSSLDAITEAKIRQFLEAYYEGLGLIRYDGSLCPEYKKGHWNTKSKIKIYKTDCHNLPANSLCIHVSIYGIGNRSMFYVIDDIENTSMTREEEVRAKIWKDINNGIVGKTYN